MSTLGRDQLHLRLQAGVATLGLVLTDAQLNALLDYLALIGKWTQVYNLTARREPGEMLSHHLLDSLAVVGPLRRQIAQLGYSGLANPPAIRLLDVGSGAGLPGVVIAICCPDISVTCVDTVSKKAAFIQQVAVSLKLPHLRSLHARVESLKAGEGAGYDVITSRAFASLADFVTGSGAALAPAGVWMAMKGKHPEQELSALPQGLEVFHVEQLQVPELDAERCLVWLRRLATA